jgi:hypothetical protein
VLELAYTRRPAAAGALACTTNIKLRRVLSEASVQRLGQRYAVPDTRCQRLANDCDTCDTVCSAIHVEGTRLPDLLLAGNINTQMPTLLEACSHIQTQMYMPLA